MGGDFEELGTGFYWQEFPVGRKLKTICRTLFESDLISFIGVTGMQEVLFNNLEYIEYDSPTGKRIVPGALVFSVAEGLVMQSTLQKTGFAFLGMFIGGLRLVYITLILEQLSPSLKIPLGLVYAVIPLSGTLIIFYKVLDLKNMRYD